MRLSIPGLPGVYYDTDSGSTAIGVATTAIGRKAPKPNGYAIQLLPYLWSFDVDLREVPNDHPIQYLHPEGAQSLGELSPQRGVREAGNELESVLRFVWSINQEVESATNQLIGRGPDEDGVVIEIQEGRVSVGGDELATDEFDLEETSAGETDANGPTTVEIADETNVIDERAVGESDADDEIDVGDGTATDDGVAGGESDADDGTDVETETGTETDPDEDVFGATEEPPADEEFGADDESDDIDPDEP